MRNCIIIRTIVQAEMQREKIKEKIHTRPAKVSEMINDFRRLPSAD